MPLGPYKNWAQCVADQIAKGKDLKQAQRICGALERDTKQSRETRKEADKK